MSGIPKTATNRLNRDYLRIKKDPVPFILAEPLPSNILEWHFVVLGPADSLYKGGYYHGTLLFPKEFPFKPPQIMMITPNGRFQTNTRLCLSISDYHPDTWNPAWSVSTILTGLLSFMLENGKTLGSIETSNYTKRQFAELSLTYNLNDSIFVDLFPDLAKEMELKCLQNDEERKQQESSNPLESNTSFGGVVSNGLVANVIFVIALVVFSLSARHIILGVMDE